jgi:ribosomal protein S8
MYLQYKSTFIRLVANLNNGVSARAKTAKVPYCEFNLKILDILCRLGYVESFSDSVHNGKPHYEVFFKFDVNGKQCLQRLRIIRTLKRQINLRNALVKDIKRGDKIFKGTWIVSTFANILTDDEALARNLRGIRFLLIT